MNFHKLRLRFIFAFAVLLFLISFANIHFANAAASQPLDTDWSTSPAAYWHQTLGQGITDPIKDLTIRVKNPDADDFYGASIYGYLTPDYASGYGIQPIEQYYFSNLGEPTPRGFDGYVTLTTPLPFSLNPNRYYKLSVLGNSFYIGGIGNDSYQNGKAYYANTSYPCNWYFNPETTCTSGDNNGIADIFFKFGTTETLSGTESLVNSISPGGFFADMNDDYIVETDNWGSLSNGISAYNISTGQKIRITENKYIRPNPVISGHKIVWGESENNNTWTQAIFMYDLDLGTATQITPAEQGISSLDFDGDYIVWASGSNYVDGNIFLYDLTKPGSPVIVDKDDPDKMQDGVSNPKVSNGKILYTWSWVCGTWCNQGELRLYNIATNEKTIVANSGGWYPVMGYEIDGDNIIIAWKTDLYNGQSINRYKISTKESTPIYSSSSGIYGFSMSDNILTWSDHYDIFIYDFATSKTGRAGIEPKASLYPKIFGKTIIWQDYRAISKMEFYQYEIIDNSVYPIPDSVLNAEAQYYNTLQNALDETTNTYSEMVADTAISGTYDAIDLLLGSALDKILKIDSKIPLRDQPKKEAMKNLATGAAEELKKAIPDPTKITTAAAAKVMKEIFLAKRDFPGPYPKFYEIADSAHSSFIETKFLNNPTENAINLSLGQVSELRDVAERTPDDIKAFKAETYDAIKKFQDKTGEAEFYLKWGGVALLGKAIIVPITAPVNLPVGGTMLAADSVLGVVDLGGDVGKWFLIMHAFGDVYLTELQAIQRYSAGLESITSTLTTGKLPQTNGEIISLAVPEKVLLNNTGSFGGKFKNTGNVTVDARLVISTIDPYGEMLKYTTETKKVSPGEETSFAIYVPFLGNPLIIGGGVGEYKVAIKAEYGVLGLEKNTEAMTKTFNVVYEPNPFNKIVINNIWPFNELFIGLQFTNNSGMLKTYTIKDEIPKEVASDLTNVQFSRPPDKILNPDPIFSWDVSLAPGESTIIQYKITNVVNKLESEFSYPAATLIEGGYSKISAQAFLSNQSARNLGTDSLGMLLEKISSLPDSAFDKNPRQKRNALVSKINEVIGKVKSGEYSDAIDKLTHDIRPKIDGQPNPSDWIIEENSRRLTLKLADDAAGLIVLMR